MTIIVTGTAGFIGFHVAKALLARDERVCGIDIVNDYYSVALKRARLIGAQRRDGKTLGPLPCAGDAPVGVLGSGRQPAKEIVMLSGPIRIAVEHAAGARFDGKTPTKSEACQAAGARDPGRVFRQCVLVRTNLQAQAARSPIHTDVGMRGANQRHAMHQWRRGVKGGPRPAQRMPLQRHAMASEIDHRDGRGVFGRHARSMPHSRPVENLKRRKF